MGGQSVTTDASIDPLTYSEIRDYLRLDEGVDETPRQYRGQTGAQDNVIPTMDIFTGVINHYPSNDLTHYLLDLRTYRPICVQHFFQDLQFQSFQKNLFPF